MRTNQMFFLGLGDLESVKFTYIIILLTSLGGGT